jgi:CBS domain-containing protein
MCPNPSVVTRNESVARAATMMRERHVGVLPVIDDLRTRHLVGIVTARDIVVRGVASSREADRCIADLMTQPPLAVVHVDADVDDVMDVMNRERVRRLPVVDDRGRVVGIVALSDVAKRLYGRHRGAFHPGPLGGSHRDD